MSYCLIDFFFILTAVFGVRRLITVASIVPIATASITIAASSSMSVVTVRLSVRGLEVVLGYVLISRHDVFVCVTITRRVSSRGIIGEEKGERHEIREVYKRVLCQV